MTESPQPRRRRWPGKRALILLTLLVAVALLLAMGLGRIDAPSRMHDAVERQLRENLDIESVEFASVTIGLGLRSASLKVAIRQLAVGTDEHPQMLEIASLNVDLAAVPAIFGRFEARAVEIHGLNVVLPGEDIALPIISPDQLPGQNLNERSQDDGLLADMVAGIDRVVVRNVTVETKASGGWSAQIDEIVMSITADEVFGRARVRIRNAAGNAETGTMSISANKETGRISVTMAVADLHLPTFYPQSAAIAALDLALDVTAEAEWDGSGEISSAEFQVGIGSGQILNLPGPPVNIVSGAARGRIDVSGPRIILDSIEADTSAGQLSGHGHADLVQAPDGENYAVGTATVRMESLWLPGLWAQSIDTASAAADFRWHAEEQKIELARYSVSTSDGIAIRGNATAQNAPDGWNLDLDYHSGGFDHTNLLRMWPQELERNVRLWLVEHLEAARIDNVAGAIRLSAGERPAIRMNFEFAGLQMAYLAGQPPLEAATGWGVLTDNDLTLALTDGAIQSPAGSKVDMSGTTFRIPDFSAETVQSNIHLETAGRLQPLLAILDLEPFGFMKQAGLNVDLVQGHVDVEADLTLPLVADIALSDIGLHVAGRVLDFESDKLLNGMAMRSQSLRVDADEQGLRIEGAGWLEDFPVTARLDLDFESVPTSFAIEGTVALSQEVLSSFGIDVPASSLAGTAELRYVITSTDSGPAKFELSGDLAGLEVTIDAINWSKQRQQPGFVTVSGLLSEPVQVTTMAYTDDRLDLQGSVLRDSSHGEVVAIDFERIAFLDHFDLSARLVFDEAGEFELHLSDGWADLRGFDSVFDDDQSNFAKAVEINLERIILGDGVVLEDVAGRIDLVALDATKLAGRLGGSTEVRIAMFQSEDGRGAMITAADAGAVLEAAGLMRGLTGGDLQVQFIPDREGGMRGLFQITNLYVKNMPMLGELLSAASIIGALEQMRGGGVHFAEVSAGFLYQDGVIRIRDGSASGASLGLTAQGWIDRNQSMVNLEGRLTPVYGLNNLVKSILPLDRALQIGKGDGLGAIKYAVKGRIESPSVTVNPLSVLTPGILGDLLNPDVRPQSE